MAVRHDLSVYLPELTTLERLTPAMISRGVFSTGGSGPVRREATELLELVGLGHRLKHKPSSLGRRDAARHAGPW